MVTEHGLRGLAMVLNYYNVVGWDRDLLLFHFGCMALKLKRFDPPVIPRSLSLWCQNEMLWWACGVLLRGF